MNRNTEHLGMDELLAVRDGDRSEPRLVAAHRHAEQCHACGVEVARLQQLAARMRALPPLTPADSHLPAIRREFRKVRRQRWERRAAGAVLAVAAMLAITLVGHDLVQPAELDAQPQIDTLMSRSEALEQTLHAWDPDSRVVDGRTLAVVLSLEDRIAAVDARLRNTVELKRAQRLQQEAALWQERVGLMRALVQVHLTKATNVDL